MTDLTPTGAASGRWSVLATLLVGWVALSYGRTPLWHTDVWAHLAYGRHIAEQGRLPQRESLNPFADQQAEFTNLQWLAQRVLHGVFQMGETLAGGDRVRQIAGGVSLLLTLQLLLTLLLFAALALAFTRVGQSLPLGCLGLLVAIVLTQRLYPVFRPQLFGLALFAILLATLSREMLSWRVVLGLPLLFVLWANLHGSFLVGLLLLGLFFAGRCLAAWPPWQDPLARRLGGVLLASLAGIAVFNPYGPRLFWLVLEFGQHPTLAQLSEWQSLLQTWGTASSISYVTAVALVVLSWSAARARPSPTQILILLVFAGLPLLRARFSVWWLPLAPWLAAPAWRELAEQRGWQWVKEAGRPTPGQLALCVVVLGLVLPWVPPGEWLRTGQPRPLERAVSAATPWRLAAQLLEPEAEPPYLPGLPAALRRYPGGRFQGTIFASETLGEYLQWAVGDRFPVTLTAHAHVFPVQHWQDCFRVLLAEPGWEAILRQKQANLIVIEGARFPDLRRQLHQSAEWEVVLDETTVPSKRNPLTRLLIALRRTPL